MRLRPYGAVLIASAAMFATISAVRPAAQERTHRTVPLVATAALRALLPNLPGWTRDHGDEDLVTLSPECGYAFANATYVKDGMSLRVMLADTGFDADSISTLAMMVTMFPDGHVGVVPPATEIKRVVFNGWPAASLWDNQKAEGEFTVLVGGRFVAQGEGKRLDSADILQDAVGRIDLKALAALK